MRPEMSSPSPTVSFDVTAIAADEHFRSRGAVWLAVQAAARQRHHLPYEPALPLGFCFVHPRAIKSPPRPVTGSNQLIART